MSPDTKHAPIRDMRAARLPGWVFSATAALLALSAKCAPVEVAVPVPSSGATAQVFFSPTGRTEDAIAAVIGSAVRRVWIAGYYFTSAPIAKALHQAHERHVDVRVVLDRSQATQRYSSASYFYNQGVPVKINARYPVMHHKFVVIDSDVVGLGSMNFTRSGSSQNAENFNLFRRWPALAETYAAEFSRLEGESEPYRPGMTFSQPGSTEALMR